MTRTDVERLKASNRIEDVVQRYIKLSRRGSNYMGLCPFHDDRNPSFVVNPAKQTYRCFACGEHGDVIGFVRRMEGVGFVEAVERLGAQVCEERCTLRAEKPLPQSAPCTEEQVKRNEAFLSTLFPYASGCTELSPTYIDFEVGVSPHLTPTEWHAMSGRIVFPIRDEEGRLIGFAGRRASDNDTDAPKYLNSSAKEGYDKGSHLYALHRAKEAIRREGFVFVTEGYKDAIAMHAAGYANTVALGGTAMTDAQAALLAGLTDTLCLLLDGDKAGRDAARKIASEKKPRFEGIRVLTLSDDADPDSLFRRLGREGFCRAVHRLLHAPHYTEEWLMAAILCLGNTPCENSDGKEERLVTMVHAILTNNDLPFESEEHRDILECLCSGQTEAELSPRLRAVADDLHAACDAVIRADLERLREQAVEEAEIPMCYINRLLWEYAEHGIMMKIRREMKLYESLVRAGGDCTDTLRRVGELHGLLQLAASQLHRPGILPFVA